MALPVLDGNQSATTLSSVVTGGEHIVAHSVVCLGSTAIANITSAVSGSVVSISNFPSTQAVAGTVTANVAYSTSITGYAGGAGSVTALPVVIADKGIYGGNLLNYNGTNTSLNISVKGIGSVSLESAANFPVSGTVTVGGFSGNAVTTGYSPIGTAVSSVPVIVMENSFGNIGTVDVSSGSINVTNSVTIGSLPAISGTVTVGNTVAISGTVTANPTGTQTIAGTVTVSAISTSVTARLVDSTGTAVSYAATGTAGTPSTDVISVQGVSGGTSLPISGTAGTLTTRFGSVTTANTAQISSAVTNTSRKYLLIQNVTTSSNVITIGIGFTPTTTQGIQLTAGAGITFESSYIPTGAVYVLSGVTASPFTILEA